MGNLIKKELKEGYIGFVRIYNRALNLIKKELKVAYFNVYWCPLGNSESN